MTFFYDLNKKLAALAGKQNLAEAKESKPDFLDVDKDGDKQEPMKKALKDKVKEVEESTGDYSAKKARAGKDIGKPGKAFAKIAKSAGERYGSKERGEKVAGAVLAKLRKGANEDQSQLEPWERTMKEEEETAEGNAFTAKLKSTPKGGKFKLGDKEFTDTSNLEEKKEKPKAKNAFDPEVARSMFAPEKGKTKTGHDVKDTGYSKRYTKSLDDEPESDDEVSDEPKKKGRKSVGAGKGKKIGAKHSGTSKLHRKAAIAETDLEEKAVSQAQQKFMGMVHAAQKGEKPASKEVAKVAKGISKKAAKDFASTKHKGLPQHVKHEEVEETTTSGSVAPVANASKSKKSGGIEFGKGVYEELNSKLETLITEGMNVSVNMSAGADGEPTKNITVSADGDDAETLAQLLNLAGVQSQESTCGCDTTPCSCEQVDEVNENNPDWPSDQETTGENDPNLERWSGGLNKPKATGQTTIPVVNRDPRRGSYGPMHENLGMNLYKELQGFKNKK